MRAFEEFDLAVILELVEVMEGHRGHAPLMRFPRAIDVEIAEAGNLRSAIVQAPAHDLVKQQFRVAIDVKRCLATRFFAEFGTAP